MAAAVRPFCLNLSNVTVNYIFEKPCVAEGWPGRDFDVLTVREVYLIKPPETSFDGAVDIKRPIFSRWIFPPEIGKIIRNEPVDLSSIRIKRWTRFSETIDKKSITVNDIIIYWQDKDVAYSLDRLAKVKGPLVQLSETLVPTTEIDSFISLGYEVDREWDKRSFNIALTD